MLPSKPAILASAVESKIVDALVGRDVKSYSIPDDNNEATILMVGGPENLRFDFDDAEYYGANELGVAFEASIDCTLNYAIFIADYYTLSDERRKPISIDERNEHYFDAEEDYTVDVRGTLLITLDSSPLEEEDLRDEDLSDLIDHADYGVEVVEATIPDPHEKW
jgi:hypothetical protein